MLKWRPEATIMAHNRIVRDPKVMTGKPCIAGTRITVQQILEDIADGMSVQDVIDAYEHITADDVRAAVAYAADYLAHEGLAAAE
jgi:uncharacterized protein (DUF433 family)